MAFNINAQIILSGPKNIDKIKNTIQTQLQSVNVPINIQLSKGLNSQINSLNKSLNKTLSTLKSISSGASAANSSLGNIGMVSSQLAGNATKASSSINNVSNSLGKVSKNAATATSSMSAFGKEAANAIRRFAAFSIATGAIYGFIRAIQNATGQAIEFDREMVRLKQVTDASATEISNMQNTIDGLSTSLGINANELAKVAVTLAQAGLSAKDTQSALKAVAKAALTPSFGNLKDTTEGVIAVLAQFGIAANKTEDILGSINAVSKAFAVESEDLISVIRRAGGVFATAAGQIKDPQEALAELLGIFTAVRSTTRESADTISTGLRTIFSRLQRKTTIEFLKQFNIDLLDSEGKFVGFYESFKRISKGLQSLTERGDTITIGAIVEELGGIRQIGKLLPVIQNFNKAEEARKVALKGTGSLTKDVAVATQSLAVQIDQLQQRFSKLIRDIAGSTTFQNLAKFALSTANAFITVADTLKPLLPLLTTFAGIQISKSLAEFSLGFIGGFKKGGGATGVGSNIGGAVSGANQQATQQSSQATVENTKAKTSNTQSITNNTTAINNLINSLGTINTAISNIPNIISSLTGGLNAVSSSITNLITAIKSIPISPPIGRTAPVKGFARGGVVPGTGNRDTVPAMLTPGEFVIKKSSVKSIGADTLTAMNENRYSKGGLIIRQTNDAYAGLFAKPKGEDQSGRPISIPLVEKGSTGQEILAATGSPKSYFIGGSDETTFENDAKNKLLQSIEEISVGLGGPKLPIPELQDSLAKAIGVSDIAGKIFEGVSRVIAGNFSGTSVGSFDIPQGTVNNTKGFYKLFNNNNPLPDINYDAKLTESRENRASLVKKAINSNLIKDDIQLTNFQRQKTTEQLIALPKGNDRNNSLIQRKKELEIARDRVASLVDPETAKLIQARIQKQINAVSSAIPPTAIRASGGSISGTDTVPALLTPGEFVINKDAASRIGYGNLDTMNKTGVSKFAKGGIVGFQKFAGGTPRRGAQPLPAQDIQLSNINMTDVNAQTKSLADILKNINSTFSKTNTDALQLEQLNKLLIDVSNEILSDAKRNVPLWKKITNNLGLTSGNISNIAIPLEDISRILTVASGNVLYINKDFEIINQHNHDLALNMQGAVNKSKIMLQGINPNFNPNIGVATGTTAPAATAAPIPSKTTLGPAPIQPQGVSTGSMSILDSAIKQFADKLNKINPQNTMSEFSKIISQTGVDSDKASQAFRTFSQVLSNSNNLQQALNRSLETLGSDIGIVDEHFKKLSQTTAIANANLAKPTPVPVATPIPKLPANIAGPMAPVTPADTPDNKIFESSRKLVEAFNATEKASSNTAKQITASSKTTVEKFGALSGSIGGLFFTLNGFASLDFSSVTGALQSLTMLSYAATSITEIMGVFGLLEKHSIDTKNQENKEVEETTQFLDILGKTVTTTKGSMDNVAEAAEGLAQALNNARNSSNGANSSVQDFSINTKRAGKNLGRNTTSKIGGVVSKAGKTGGLIGSGLKGLKGAVGKGTIGAILASLAVEPAFNALSSGLGKKTISGVSGFSGPSGGTTAKTVGTAQGAVGGALTGASAGSLVAGPIGTVIGAIGGAIVGGIKGYFDAQAEQIKFEALTKLSIESDKLGKAFDKLGDQVGNIKLFDTAFKQLDTTFTQVLSTQQKIASADWAGGKDAASSISDVYAGMNDGFFGFLKDAFVNNPRGKALEATQTIGASRKEGQALQQAVDTIKTDDLNKTIAASQKYFQSVSASLTTDQGGEFLKQGKNKNLVELGKILSEISGDSGRAAQALQGYQKAIALKGVKQALDDINKQAEGADNKAAVLAQKKPFSAFLQELNKTKDVDKAANAFTKNLTTVLQANLTKKTGGLLTKGKDLGKILGLKDQDLGSFDKVKKSIDKIFESPEKNKQAIADLASAYGVGTDEVYAHIQSLYANVDAMKGSEDAQKLYNMALEDNIRKLSTNIKQDIDAFVAALDRLSSGISGAVSDMGIAAANIDNEIQRIVSGDTSVTAGQRINPFENITNRTVGELQSGVDRIINTATMGVAPGEREAAKTNLREGAFKGLAETAKFQEKAPFIFKNIKSELQDLEKVSGPGGVSFTQFFDVFKKQAGAAFEVLPDKVKQDIEKSLSQQFDRKRQGSEGGITDITAFLDESGTDLTDSIGKISEETRAKLASVTSAFNEFEQMIAKSANNQALIYDQLSQAQLKYLDLQEAYNDRLSKFKPFDERKGGSELDKANSRLTERINTLVSAGGAGNQPGLAAANINNPESLLTRRQQLETQRQNLMQQIGVATGQTLSIAPTQQELDNAAKSADNQQTKELIGQLAANSKALDGTNKALDTLSNDTTRLAAIESDLAKIQEARMTGRERLAALGEKLGDARTPRQRNKVLTEFFKPVIAARKAAAGKKIDPANAAAILRGGDLLRDAFGEAAAEVAQAGAAGGLLGNIKRQGAAAGGGRFFEDIANRTLNKGGAATAVQGKTVKERELQTKADELLAQSKTLLEGQANYNISLIEKQQKIFQQELDKTYQKILMTIKGFEQLRGAMPFNGTPAAASARPISSNTTTMANDANWAQNPVEQTSTSQFHAATTSMAPQTPLPISNANGTINNDNIRATLGITSPVPTSPQIESEINRTEQYNKQTQSQGDRLFNPSSTPGLASTIKDDIKPISKTSAMNTSYDAETIKKLKQLQQEDRTINKARAEKMGVTYRPKSMDTLAIENLGGDGKLERDATGQLVGKAMTEEEKRNYYMTKSQMRPTRSLEPTAADQKMKELKQWAEKQRQKRMTTMDTFQALPTTNTMLSQPTSITAPNINSTNIESQRISQTQQQQSVSMSPESIAAINNLKTSLSSFDTMVTKLETLQNMNMSVEIGDTAVDVRINSGGLIAALTENIRGEILNTVSEVLKNNNIRGSNTDGSNRDSLSSATLTS